MILVEPVVNDLIEKIAHCALSNLYFEKPKRKLLVPINQLGKPESKR